MNYISVENLGKNFGERVLFEGLNFGLAKSDKTALIAANGTGKSSLLKILAGQDQPEHGEVVIRKGLKIGFLEQEPDFDGSLSISEVILGSDEKVNKAVSEYEKALRGHSKVDTASTRDALEIAGQKMDLLEAWDYQRRMKSLLDMFRITDLEQKTGELSGGQKKRLALAIILLDEPDILLLDEPTNHLDIDMIEWLEKHLSQPGISFLMVTHDRYFLNRICTGILELSFGELYFHKGNYEYFLEKKAERENAFQAETDKASKFVRRELDWIKRMPKARTTKSKSRIDAFYDMKDKAGVRRDQEEIKLEMNMKRLGGKILEISNLSKSFGDNNLLSGFSYVFTRGERLGIIGANGTGKTTLLNLITDRITADSGFIDTGETILYGYYTQEGIKLDEDKRVIEVVKEIAEVIDTGNGSLSASQFLQFFLFPPEMQYTYVSKLSGGEKRRLYLLTVLIKNPNFLILDEPTNDLDIVTLSRLEEFLMAFKGCLVIVSHDRFFLDRMVDHLFIFEGNGKIENFYGNYSDYRNSLLEEESAKRAIGNQVSGEKVKSNDRKKTVQQKKLSYKEKLEYENLENEIAKLEEEKVLLESKLNSGENDYEKLQEFSSRIGEIIGLIDIKTLRWLDLDEIINS